MEKIEEILILLEDSKTQNVPLFLSLDGTNLDMKHYETDGVFGLPFKYKKGIEVNIGDMFHLTTITQPGSLEYKIRGLDISEMITVNNLLTDIICSDRNHPMFLYYMSYKQYEDKFRISQSIIVPAIRENTLSNILDK